MKISRLIITVILTAIFLTTYARDKPNIVFILADDMGYGDLGCFGSDIISTPNIDQLAEQGMKFQSFYVHNRCSPTRGSFMTGCYAQRVDLGKVIYRHDSSGINSNEITIAELLNDAGYATGIIGKWHLGKWPQFNPLNHGFDYFYGLMDDENGKEMIFENRQVVGEIDRNKDRYGTMAFQPASIKFMRKHKDNPFFLYYASHIPHSKWIPHEAFEGTSKQGAYGDCVQQLDWVVGEILKELEALGLADNTLVVFASDNGPQLNIDGYGSAGPLRDGKWTDFEGGIRVPCVMRWPGKIPEGTVNNEITGIIDMLPTFCELAGINAPYGEQILAGGTERVIDGKSIVPYMLGEEVQEPIHTTFIVPGATIRHGDWKLLVKYQKPGGNIRPDRGMQGRTGAEAGSLFNLENDIGEQNDVSSEHPGIVKELEAMMNDFMEEFNNSIRPREYIEVEED